MKKNVFLRDMINETLTLMKSKKANLSPITIHEHELSYEIILLHLESMGINSYDKSVVTPICDDLCQKDNIGKTRAIHISVALNKLDYYHQFNALQPPNYSRLRLECQNKDHKPVVEGYLQYCLLDLGMKESTLKVKRVSVINFMDYLAATGIAIDETDAQTIIDYLVLADKKSNWTESTKNMNRYQVRHFLSYLIKYHQMPLETATPLQVIFGCHEVHLPSYYEPEEIKALLDSIDISSPAGKRDYLICLLVSQLGLRSSDVINLSFSNIHWDTETIELFQKKTKSLLVLPLLANIKFAILDYWKNVRAESDSELILITQSNPHRKLSNSYLSAIVSGRLRNAHIDIQSRKHGCHAMRHSLARNLLSSNEGLSTITGILGHKNSNTTRKYLGIDTKGLRKISLEVCYGQK
ncbi:tyrosine-type recombinase/integrase [bacterium]|nr:tyrosine-type recombinase/integrase [bacterium]